MVFDSEGGGGGGGGGNNQNKFTVTPCSPYQMSDETGEPLLWLCCTQFPVVVVVLLYPILDVLVPESP